MGFVDSAAGADGDAVPTTRPQPDNQANLAEAVFIAAAVAVVCVTSVGLVAAMLGVFSALLAVVGGAVATTLLLTIAVQLRSNGWTVRWRDWTLLPPVAVIALISAWSATHTGQTLLIGRDPGSYLNTARWLARDGSLAARGGSAVLDGLPGVQFAGPAVYDMGGGNLEFQFSHGAGVALATMYDLLGVRGLFNANILVGAVALLGWYCLLRRLDVGRSVSLAAIVALGISIPYLNVTRATYSEPYVLLLAGASLLMLVWAPTTRRPGLLVFFAGLFAGGTILFRIDGLLYVAALFIAVAVVTLAHGPRMAVAAFAGAAVPSAIGIVDQQYFTGNYATDLMDSVRPLAALTVVSFLALVGALVVSRRQSLSQGLSRHSARILAIATSSVVVAAWLIRPLIETSTKARSSDHPGYRMVAGLQQREGLAIDGTQMYSELSVRQIGWYFGAFVVAAAAIGFGLIMYRAARQPASRWGPLLLFSAVATPLYIWKPSIFPDHPWYTRRFVPFVYPVFLTAAAVLITAIVEQCRHRWDRRWASAVTALACIGLVLPTAIATAPVRSMTNQRGVHGLFVEACQRIPPGSSVLTVDVNTTDMALRSWCGAAVASTTIASESIDLFIRRAHETCASAFIVARPGTMIEAPPQLVDAPTTLVSESWGEAEFTLTHRPDRIIDTNSAIDLWTVLPDERCSGS